MAKTEAAVARPASGSVKVTGTTVAALKEEGSRAFAMKEYQHAMAAWDKALGMDGLAASDASLIHNNKAACHMVSKRYKEAVSECGEALKAQPQYFKALVRRSKAHEAMGQYKEALNDLQAANKLDSATDDSRAAERRVRDLAAGKKPAGLGNGLSRRTAAAAGAKTAGGAASRHIPIKLTFGNDVRSFPLVPGVKYSELMDYVRQLFPNAGHFVLKYVDKEGDLVTIASRQDLHVAIQEAADAAARSGNRLQAGTLPPVRLQVIKVASAADVPRVPEDEQQYMQQLLEQIQRAQNARSQQSGGAAAAAQQQLQQPQVQVDDWIANFVELFKEYCGLDVDRPLEAQEIGNDRLNTAFHAMMQDDEKTDDLLQQAHDKFREQAAVGMLCQAQVHEARATRLMYKAAKEGAPASTIAAEAEKHLAAAEAKTDEALAYCPNIIDGYLTRNNIHLTRAKIAANYLIEPVVPKEESADEAAAAAAQDPKVKAEADDTAARELSKKAASRVTAESAKAAEAHMERGYAALDDGMEALPQEERERELKPLKPMAEQVPGDPASETPLKASMLINMGNARYEHSILRAAGGLDWRSLIEKAAELFREAGAAEVDIRNALKGHPMAEQMEDLIGPEPQPEKPKEAPKGLPALPRKK